MQLGKCYRSSRTGVGGLQARLVEPRVDPQHGEAALSGDAAR